jgi:hypothetical protein
VPVISCGNGKYRIGTGKCMYDSKEKAERAYKGYLVQKHMNELKELREQILAEKSWIQSLKK